MDLEQTFKWMDQQYKDGDRFELVAIKDATARRKTFTWDGGWAEAWGDPGQAITEALGAFEALGFDVYASALPLGQQEAGKYDRIWIDQDDLGGPWPWGTDGDLQWPKAQTFVKTSEEGGAFRWQAIWHLTEELDADEAKRVMQRLSKLIGADPKVFDPRRILRVPGIINAKRGVMASYMGGDKGAVSLDAFNLPAETAVTKLMDAQVSKPQGILGEWLAGFGEGERNQKAYICARFLKSCDVSHDDALAIVAVGARRCTPSLDEQEVFNAVRSAFHAG